jgi:hypothetical protein
MGAILAPNRPVVNSVLPPVVYWIRIVQIQLGSIGVEISAIGSLIHMQAAKRLSAAADTLDNLDEWKKLTKADQDERDATLIETSLAAVVTAFSSVDSVVNELFLEVTWFPKLTDAQGKVLGAAWPHVSRKPVQMRVDRALSELKVNHSQNWWGQGVPQEFGLLQSLRNGLLHHAPYTWKPATGDDPLEISLSRYFARSRIWCERNPPYRWAGCLGGPCAKWAFATAQQFQRELFHQLINCDYPSAKV